MINRVHTLSGAALTTGYGAGTASAPFQVGGASFVRFYCDFTPGSGSNITAVTLKLQLRYNDGGGITGAWLDLPSTNTADTSMAVEHSFDASAQSYSFSLDHPEALLDARLDAHADAVGVAGDELDIYAVLA